MGCNENGHFPSRNYEKCFNNINNLNDKTHFYGKSNATECNWMQLDATECNCMQCVWFRKDYKRGKNKSKTQTHTKQITMFFLLLCRWYTSCIFRSFLSLSVSTLIAVVFIFILEFSTMANGMHKKDSAHQAELNVKCILKTISNRLWNASAKESHSCCHFCCCFKTQLQIEMQPSFLLYS